MNRNILLAIVVLVVRGQFAAEANGQGGLDPSRARGQTSSDGPVSRAAASSTGIDGEATRGRGEMIRTWTNTQGKRIEAKFIGVSGRKVIILKDGKTFSYPFAGLSPADREFVRERLKARAQNHLIPGLQGAPKMAGDTTIGPGRLGNMPGMPLRGTPGMKLLPSSGSGFKCSLDFSYQVFSDGIERVVSATLFAADEEGSEQPLRRAQYTYYTGSGGPDGSSSSSPGTTEHGSLGDLKTVTLQEYVGEKWYTVETYYYRYYTDGNRAHRPKYVLGPEAYEKLINDPEVTNPFTASEEKVAQYATKYLEYDSSGRLLSRGDQEAYPQEDD